MLDVGEVLTMYGNAQFMVIQKYLNFMEIPRGVFPTSPEDFWKTAKKDWLDYKKAEPWVVIRCVNKGETGLKKEQQFILPARVAEKQKI